MLTYSFRTTTACDMCGAGPDQFAVLGLRLNRSQGLNPKAADGIAVTVKKCGRCGLIFADPQPVPANFDDHYGTPEEYWNAGYFEDEPGYFQPQIAVAKRLLQFRPGMTALDVGAGLGKAMRAMTSAGFETWGLEPSSPFRSAALKLDGISDDRLALAGIEDATYEREQFDFVSFGAVLEHLPSPSRSLERALGWLKPGGVVQAEVPSSRWLISRLVNAYYYLRGTTFVTNISPMHRPFHLFEFGSKSFELHGRRAGYELAEHRFMVCSIPHAPRAFHAPLRSLMERTGTGMQLEVFLRKIPETAKCGKYGFAAS